MVQSTSPNSPPLYFDPFGQESHRNSLSPSAHKTHSTSYNSHSTSYNSHSSLYNPQLSSRNVYPHNSHSNNVRSSKRAKPHRPLLTPSHPSPSFTSPHFDGTTPTYPHRWSTPISDFPPIDW